MRSVTTRRKVKAETVVDHSGNLAYYKLNCFREDAIQVVVYPESEQPIEIKGPRYLTAEQSRCLVSILQHAYAHKLLRYSDRAEQRRRSREHAGEGESSMRRQPISLKVEPNGPEGPYILVPTARARAVKEYLSKFGIMTTQCEGAIRSGGVDSDDYLNVGSADLEDIQKLLDNFDG